MLWCLAMICTAPRLPPGCLCVGGAGYGNVCAAWDAADEEPWCRVSTRDACGEDETFVSGAHFWAHRACSGRGATFDTVTARVRNAVPSVEPRGVCDRAAGGGARLSGADAACCRVFDGKRGATVNQQQKCCRWFVRYPNINGAGFWQPEHGVPSIRRAQLAHQWAVAGCDRWHELLARARDTVGVTAERTALAGPQHRR